MNLASNNFSGMTNTTLLDISSSADIDRDSSNGSANDVDYNAHIATLSGSPLPSDESGPTSRSNSHTDHVGNEGVEIYDYKERRFVWKSSLDKCEEICLEFCRLHSILPTTRLLFGLRVYKKCYPYEEWAAQDQQLRRGERYCFRMRFKVPSLDTHLKALDLNSFEYLYWQMRHDVVNDCIPKIHYPAKKDSVMGLGVLDMYIDTEEHYATVENIEANCRQYLPRALWRAHWLVIKKKVRDSYRAFRERNIALSFVKSTYVHEVHNLVPDYLMERFRAKVDYMPLDEFGVEFAPTNTEANETPVYVEIDLQEKTCIKIARIAAENKLEWMQLVEFDHLSALCDEGEKNIRLEINGIRNGYCLEFDNRAVKESFISYLAGYHRLTTKWMTDLCSKHSTPSLKELKELRCHGPIGGHYSFAKIRITNKSVGSYIIRQCEKEYDTYYIDIITKDYNMEHEKCKTETFKIKKDKGMNSKPKWILHWNDGLLPFDEMSHIENFIPTEALRKTRIPPTENEKPLPLLICLPKKLQSRKTEMELSQAELQRKRVQIFIPKIDLQIYNDSVCECDNGKMIKLRADWIQQNHGFKDVRVTMKLLRNDNDFPEFMKLSNTWSQVSSPYFIKLYGLTLSTPYTMVLECSPYGPLNELLERHRNKISINLLLNVVLDLVRGVYYLQKENIVHGRLRCSNLLVTKFDPNKNLLQTKIADPGFPRAYNSSQDLPWIPFEHYNNLNAASKDIYADLWAFATTTCEIFSGGQSLTGLTAEQLKSNYRKEASLLPKPKDCPSQLYHFIMYGWNPEPVERFKFHEILSCIRDMESHYESVRTDDENGDNYEESEFSNGFSDTASTNCDSVIRFFDNHPNHQPVNGHQVQNSHHRHQLLHGSYLPETRKVLKTPIGKVICHNKIGEGHYGYVYKGELQYDDPEKEPEKVAIKMLKTTMGSISKDFGREIKIMQNLDHPNIVKIKTSIEKPLSIIMEYLECGSFLVYLTTEKPNLTDETLLYFAKDIARGMDYLESQHVIHRDLAARNILVDRDRVKISDFGLAQIADGDGYYYGSTPREIPIKWYSPESIRTEKFSYQSDVWSFGVTLFEMFSRGETPYLEPNKELENGEFLGRLEKGERLRKPENCPDVVYNKLMLPCWHCIPKMRPNFKQLINEIQSIINESGEIIWSNDERRD